MRSSLWFKLTYLLIVTGILFTTFFDNVYDDPFITYRYAENLRNGIGFVYNTGEYILSTTTPLFAVILAILGNLWVNTQYLANFIGVISIAVGGLLLWELGQTWETPIVGWSGLLLYPTFPLLLSTLGSETPLFITFVLGAFLFYARKNHGWSVLLITLAILTRSDGVIAGSILGVHYFWINRSQFFQSSFWRRQPWLWFGVATGILVIWHGFAWFYFGSPLPVTLAVKQAQGRMAISQLFVPGILRVGGWYFGNWEYWVEFGLVFVGLIFSISKKRPWLLIVSWVGLYFLSYSLLGVTSYFWYYAPIVPVWVILVGLGFAFFLWFPLQISLKQSLLWDKIRVGLVGLLLMALFISQVIDVQKLNKRTDPRYVIYRAVGEWLAKNTPPETRVGALEVGIIGYYAQRAMVDFAGLIQPEVAGQMEKGTTYDDTAVWAMQNFQPEYLVVIANSQLRLKSEVIDPYCEIEQRFLGSKYAFNADINIYRCRFD